LLSSVGVGGTLWDRIMDSIRSGPRTGKRLTHKGAIALLHLAEISELTGIEIDRGQLVKRLHRGVLSFEDDSALEIVDEGTRRHVHDAALEASRRHGFLPYVEFFGSDRVKGGVSPSPLEIDHLTREDMRQVASLGRSGSPNRARGTPA
jgi:hypothetical protein